MHLKMCENLEIQPQPHAPAGGGFLGSDVILKQIKDKSYSKRRVGLAVTVSDTRMLLQLRLLMELQNKGKMIRR